MEGFKEGMRLTGPREPRQRPTQEKLHRREKPSTPFGFTMSETTDGEDKPVDILFLPPFPQHLLSAFYVQSTMQGPGDVTGMKTDKTSVLMVHRLG